VDWKAKEAEIIAAQEAHIVKTIESAMDTVYQAAMTGERQVAVNTGEIGISVFMDRLQQELGDNFKVMLTKDDNGALKVTWNLPLSCVNLPTYTYNSDR